MKLISCLLILFLIEMHNAKQKSTPPNVIRIPLTKPRPKMKKPVSGHAKATINLDDTTTDVHKGKLSIGTPPQNFEVVFDSGSSDLFVLSRNYDTCAENYQETMNVASYDRSASSTYEQAKSVPKPQVIEYATAWVFGFRSSDVIQIADDQVRTEFLEVTRTSEARVGAVLGMMYDVRKGSPISKLCKEAKGEQKFSFYLPREKGSSQGELLLCGINHTRYHENTIQYVDEVNPGEWFFKVDKVEMNSPGKESRYISEKVLGIADTGSNRILTPPFAYKSLEDESKPYIIRKNATMKRINCANARHLPVLNLTVGAGAGIKLSLTADDYLTKYVVGGTSICYFPFREDSLGRWVFGESFFRKYYTIYDMENHKVGFAESKG